MAKPFKETALGKFLAGKGLDKALEIAGDFIPGVAALDKLKDAVLGDPAAAAKLTAEDRARFMELYKLELEELDKRLADTASARTREVEFVKATGHMDWFMTVFGTAMMVLFAYTIIVSSTGNIPADMREIFIEGRAAVRDIVLTIAAYYWGSSASSRVAQMRINRDEAARKAA